MAKIPQIGENTKFTLDVKTIGIIISFVVGLSTTYFTLKSDIALAIKGLLTYIPANGFFKAFSSFQTK